MGWRGVGGDAWGGAVGRPDVPIYSVGTKSSDVSRVSQYITVRMNDFTMHTHIFTLHAYINILDPGIYLLSRKWREHAEHSQLVVQHRPINRVWRRRRRGQCIPGLRDSGIGEPLDGANKGYGDGGPDGVTLVGQLQDQRRRLEHNLTKYTLRRGREKLTLPCGIRTTLDDCVGWSLGVAEVILGERDQY